MSDISGADRDALAFEALYVRHVTAVTAYFVRRLPEDEVDDAVAEVFTSAWRRFGDLPDEPLPWLYSTAAHHLAHARRGHARRTRLSGRIGGIRVDPGADATDEIVSEIDDRRLVNRAMAKLSERDAEVLRLWAWERLEPSEMAVVLGCSPGAARVRLHRAQRRMAALLEPPPRGALRGVSLGTTRDTSQTLEVTS